MSAPQNVDPHRKIMKGGSFVNIASSLRVPEILIEKVKIKGSWRFAPVVNEADGRLKRQGAY